MGGDSRELWKEEEEANGWGKGKGGKKENGKLRVFPIPRKSHNSFLVFSNTHIRIRKSCAMLFANLGNCNFI